ncbi:hypothetical protein [Haloflavibacter putidus]|uniref:50S ribosomal protein L27 n=1 Tax=Haloflavibacter putidus TaxID=2576776 RepID=A0A507ZNC7_9FLAO|nr:hypothetical protein [Haloflavibacter putidus]TQD38487.1 hypothetical protein FKR84_08695 [Haloflavibacter putidus]
MYTAFLHLHSFWAYLVLLLIILATFNAIFGWAGKRSYAPKDFRISLFALIATHIQLLLGLILFFVSPQVRWFSGNVDMGSIMSNPTLRLYNVEHPLLMIVAVILITIGYSRHKKKLASNPKFKSLSIFYSLALLATLAMIPWAAWL